MAKALHPTSRKWPKELKHQFTDVSRHGSPHWVCRGCDRNKEDLDPEELCLASAQMFVERANRNQAHLDNARRVMRQLVG